MKTELESVQEIRAHVCQCKHKAEFILFRFEEARWMNLQVGDVVRLKKNDFIPVRELF